MASVGRPPHPASTVALVRQLLGEQLSPRAIVRQAAGQGIRVSRSTVRQIRDGSYRVKRESTSRLLAGETRLSTPQRCPDCKGNVIIVPCRLCRALATADALRKLIEAREARKASGTDNEPRRTRGKAA